MDCTGQLQRHTSFLSVYFRVKYPVSSCLTFGLLAGAAFCVQPHSASHAWRWPDATLGRDAERAPCMPPSPAIGLAFGPLGLPIKKPLFSVSHAGRHSDLTSCICGLWLSLGLSNLHGEKVPFVHVSADKGLFRRIEADSTTVVHLPTDKPQGAIVRSVHVLV